MTIRCSVPPRSPQLVLAEAEVIATIHQLRHERIHRTRRQILQVQVQLTNHCSSSSPVTSPSKMPRSTQHARESPRLIGPTTNRESAAQRGIEPAICPVATLIRFHRLIRPIVMVKAPIAASS
jgi:hypothetical protein